MITVERTDAKVRVTIPKDAVPPEQLDAGKAKTVKNLCWFQVVETRGNIDKGKVQHWQVTIKVGFSMEA